MPDLDQIKQEEQGCRTGAGRFSKDRLEQSPAEHYPGLRSNARQTAKRLLEGETEALNRKAAKFAFGGGEMATIAAVAATFVRAIETNGFERRLQAVEAGHVSPAAAEAGLYRAGPNGTTTPGRNLAADLLQIAGRETTFSIGDCSA